MPSKKQADFFISCTNYEYPTNAVCPTVLNLLVQVGVLLNALCFHTKEAYKPHSEPNSLCFGVGSKHNR